MTTLSVVIPALNEEDGIVAVVERVLAVRPGLAAVGVDDLELIVVDDGSTDRTPALLAAIPEVRMIRHEVNRGYGAALKSGFGAAVGEWIGFLDADGTYPPEYFPELFAAGQRENADIVIGSRMAGAESQMPAVRRLGNLLFAGLVSLISTHRVTDSASGMRIFKRSLLERIYPLPDGLNLTPIMSMRALHERLRMVEVPIPYSERAGRSKLNVIRDGMRFAQSIVWTSLSYNPVRVLGLLGLTALLLSLVIGLGLVALRLSGVTTISTGGAFNLFLGLVLGVTGICLLTLGISFNYFVALFHKRPVQQGLFGRSLFRGRMENHFGWMGVGLFGLGVALGLVSLYLGRDGWEATKVWLYYLISASLALTGVQLTVAWIQMQVLYALSERESLIRKDMHSAGVEVGREKGLGGISPLVAGQELHSHG